VAVADSQFSTEGVNPRVARSRAAILAAASDLLIEGGLSALTVDAVSDRSGVSKTTMYRHWSSRDELVVDTFRYLTPDLHLPPDALSFEARLQDLVAQVVDAFRSPGWQAMLPSLLEAARHSASIQSLRHRMDQNQAELFDAVLADGIASGCLPKDCPIEEARLQILGPIQMATIHRPELVDRRLGERFVELFLASRR
jgi:AcrR family transcriptional regulator